MKLFLSPHNDDAVLFASFTLLREDPLVLTVFRSHLQESRGRPITAQMREAEDECAFAALGITHWDQWAFSDRDPDWEGVRHRLMFFTDSANHVYAPAPYDEGGHPQHDQLGRLALELWPREKVTLYHTYRNGRGREEGSLVEIRDGHWIRKKLQALACYESQIMEQSTGHHFAQALHEWYA